MILFCNEVIEHSLMCLRHMCENLKGLEDWQCVANREKPASDQIVNKVKCKMFRAVWFKFSDIGG